MNIHILYGTESGNAELLASDVSDELEGSHSVVFGDLGDFDPSGFDDSTLYLIVCSTHGEGELPQSARPFADACSEQRPDLAGVRYAMFGLGDSTYANYSRGSEHIDEMLSSRGATRVGGYGRHDAAGHYDASQLACEWAAGVLAAEAVLA